LEVRRFLEMSRELEGKEGGRFYDFEKEAREMLNCLNFFEKIIR
jgi:hypothetical protein